MMILDQIVNLTSPTPAEQALATYISDHPVEVVRIPISELARRTATSNATILRFCRRLGFDGFRSFRIQLIAEVERGADSKRIIDPDYPVTPRQSTSELLDNIADLTKDAVNVCRSAIRAADIQHVSRDLERASVVFLFGVGDSQISSEAFANLLIKLGTRCLIADRKKETASYAHAARPGDIAIVTSYSGKHIRYLERSGVLQALRANGCRVIAITAMKETSPWIDRAIRFPLRESAKGKMATFYSQACIRYIFNCLYAELWSLNYEESYSHVQSVQSIADKS